MTSAAPGPGAATTQADFVAQLRALRAWSGFSYRDLERRARAQGDKLPASTVASALNRQSLPHLDLLTALIRACGGGDADVAQWAETRRLLAQQASGGSSADPNEPVRTAARRSPDSPGGPDRPPVPCLLPPDLPAFVGRDQELAAARGQLAVRSGSVPLLITGPAGVGKTAFVVRLGHALAGRFPDGQLYVDLQGFGAQPADPHAVLGLFLRALGVRGGAVPGDLTSRIHLYRTLLAQRKVLVILDNAADARQVRDLRPNGRQCATIVASRATLAGVDGRRTHLDILTTDQALTLLGNMIGPQRCGQDPSAARSIVEACGRLPLAVWVAGARLAARPHWSLAGMADALTNEHRKLDELMVGDIAVRASLELTYRAMRPSTQHALRMLSLLPGPDFSSWAVAALVDTTIAAAENLLDDLVEVHLLAINGSHRYRMHDLVRLLGRERAAQEQTEVERAAGRRRVLSASLALTDRAATELSTDFHGLVQQHLAPWRLPANEADRLLADPLGWLTDEHAFLAAVVEDGLDRDADTTLAACLAGALTTFFQIGSHFDLWERLQTRALDQSRRMADHSSAATLHRCLGELTTILDRYPEALGHFREALRLAAPGEPASLASATAGLAYVHRLLGDYDQAVEFFEQAARLARASDNINCLIYATNGIGVVELEQGRYIEARRRFAECLELSQRSAYRPGEAQALRCLGQTHRALTDYEQAADCFERAARISTDLGDRLGATHATCWLGDVRMRLGHHANARRLLAQSLWTYREFGNLWGEAAVLYCLAEAQLAVGRPARAYRRAFAAVALWRQIGADHWLAVGQKTLAEARRQLADADLPTLSTLYEAAVRPD